MGLHHLAEAILRVEHKIDALMRHLKVKSAPMGFIGAQCPVCLHPIKYEVDFVHQIVVRRCNCKTGKVPSTFPLLPVKETPNASHKSRQQEATGDGSASELPDVRPKNGPGGKAR